MIEVLVSTMRQINYDLIKRMNIKTNAVVVNQTKEKIINKIDNQNIVWVDVNEKGLSKSRNLALEKSKAKYGLIADDDLIYVNDYENIILTEFEKNPNADIIAFQVEGIEEKHKDYSSKEKRINYLSSMKISSVELALNLNKIKEKGIKFNEQFGSGAQYFLGEENIFLFDCLRKGLNIYYVPKKIANLHLGDSTWFRGYNKDFFISRGANYAAMSKFWSLLLILQFSIRKRSLYKEEMSFLGSFKNMKAGRKEYLDSKSF